MKTDRELMDELISYRAYFVCYARGISNDHCWVEDAVQEAYIRAMLNLNQFERGTNVKAWFNQILKNYLFSQYRKTKYVTRVEEVFDDMTEPVPDIHYDRYLAQQALEQIQSIITPDQHKAFEHIMSGLEYQEIAEIEGIPLGTVKSRISRFKQKMQEEFT